MGKSLSIIFTICLILLLGVSNPVLSQNLSFNKISVNEGLSQISVNKLAQDSIGRIWIGTRDGLNVYTGGEMKNFRPVRGDSTSLLGYFVIDIVPDGDYLWIVSKDGVSLLDAKTLKFKQYPKNDCRRLIKYQDNILIGTQKGLLNLNAKTGEFAESEAYFSEHCRILCLHTDPSGMFWIGTDNGLFAYNPEKEITTKILEEPTSTVFTDSKKRIWIGTLNSGVFLYNSKQQRIKHFTSDNTQAEIVNNTVRDIDEGPNGNIWVGTFLGLSIIDGDNYSVCNYSHEEDNEKSIAHNSIYSILKDQQGNMWLGTYFGGISYMNNDIDVYKEYPVTDNNSPSGLSFSVVGEMLEDSKSNIWIATEGGGINYYNRNDNTYMHYHKDQKQGISGNNIKDITFADKATLLIGTHTGGLNMLDIVSGKAKSFPELPYKTIDEIIPYKSKYLLGTKQGIIEFDANKEVFEPFFLKKEEQEAVGNSIICLFEDSYDNLWIGTEKNGLLCYDTTTKELKRYMVETANPKSISANSISCIYEDHLFRLWIGTHGGGLNLYNRKLDEFTNYNRHEHGLSSDFIQGIKESRYGNLWITCSKGISRFDVENSKVYNYTQKNGLPLNEINKGALLLTANGDVFVGGVDGLISFNEEIMLKRQNDFKLILSSISVNNKMVFPGDESGVLSNDLPYTNEITLKPSQNAFTINYSASNFVTTNQNTYRYKLENFDDNWINAGYRNSLTYTNLNPGKYILHIEGVSGVEETVVDSRQLVIRVLPPLYRTWYAIAVYIIVLVFIILWLNRNFKNKLKLINKIEYEQNEKEQIKALNQSKLNFFTNISHEFRTPLTLITGTLESVLENNKTRPDNYRKLVTVHNSAVRLNNLITELLDFRKLETGNSKLRVKQHCINDFVGEIYQSFVEYADAHQINYSYIPMPDPQYLWFDQSQMEKVFYNVISNAFKFVEDSSGKIEISVCDKADTIQVIISDNGIGIKADKAKHIFDLYYQIENLEGEQYKHSSGIGLALSKGILEEHKGAISLESEARKGATFTICLRKGTSHFNKKDIAEAGAFVENESVMLKAMPEEMHVEEVLYNDEKQDVSTVLIVEDNRDIQTMLSNILQSSYKVIKANDGNNGFEMAIKHQPDLIISDVMMPNMSGTEMCVKVKRNIQTSHIPVILLTARASVKYKIDGLETGADDYITKPFNINLLKARVRNVIQNRILLQQKYKQDPSFEVKELAVNSMDSKLLEKVKTIIDNNLDNSEFDIQEFANEMGIGRTKLYAKIKGLTGQTPNDFILTTRLKKAAEMLLKTDEELNVSEVAYSVGFSTPRYFSRCFRQHFGVSPSKYGKS